MNEGKRKEGRKEDRITYGRKTPSSIEIIEGRRKKGRFSSASAV